VAPLNVTKANSKHIRSAGNQAHKHTLHNNQTIEQTQSYIARCYITMYTYIPRGPEQRGRYGDSQRTGDPGDRIPVGEKLSAPVHNGPGVHPTYCTLGTGPFQGVQRRGVAIITHPLLAPRTKKQQTYTSNACYQSVQNLSCSSVLSKI